MSHFFRDKVGHKWDVHFSTIGGKVKPQVRAFSLITPLLETYSTEAKVRDLDLSGCIQVGLFGPGSPAAPTPTTALLRLGLCFGLLVALIARELLDLLQILRLLRYVDVCETLLDELLAHIYAINFDVAQ